MPKPLDMLAGRTALVTGAGNGLGRAISLALIHAGCRVILVGRNSAKLETVATECEGDTRTALCDVASTGDVEELRAELIDEEVSILINNAGVGGPVKDLVHITPEEWDDVFATNVRGVYLMCRAFLPAMIERGAGDVINLASVSGKRPLTRRTPYTASKMAVIGLTSTLAWEVGPHGVSVNSLSPGPVDGERMTRNFTRDAAVTGRTYDEAREEFVSRAALQRMVTEEEVGNAVIAMLNMSGLCGADIDLSAGMIAR